MRSGYDSAVMAIVLATTLILVGCASAPANHRNGVAAHHPGDAGVEGGPVDRARRALAVAEDMLGVPYRYGGTNPSGFDCSGLVYYSFSRIGVEVPRTTRQQYAATASVSPRALRPGDVVFFRLTGAKSSHVGIYAGQGEFIHAPSAGKRVTRSSLDNPYWREHLVRGGRFL